jgi:eukaryotic-like serine/threonine-protein kinase
MDIAPGTYLGPYEILSVLGSGGMGTVYRARDSRLGREVAVKVSKQEFNHRFEGEARIIARLNHPHICRIYDVGPNYLVMELVEGIPLKVPLPLPKTLVYAEQILDALDAAHRKGILHRDLKPGNILITREGIKLLDFGVATLNSPASAGPMGETSTVSRVEPGAISGTVQYMSPEQVNGKQVDARSDLFSFGSLLYEMLCGERAFDGPSTAAVIAAILEREPAPIKIPAAINRVMRRSLAKDPDDRYQTARDLKAALLWAGELAQDPPVPPPASQRRLLQTAASAAIPAAIVFAALWFLWPKPAKEPLAFTVEAPPNVIFNYLITASAISPDGRFIILRAAAEGGTPSLWLRPLDSLVARRLAGSDGGDYPFWSPDSRSIAYFAAGKLERLDLLGSAPTVLCDADAANAVAGGTWSISGTILFADRRGLLTISSNGGTPSLVMKAEPASDEGPYGYPQFLPDGMHYLYFRQSSSSGREGIYAASLATPKQSKQVVSTSSKAIYEPPVDGHAGQLLFLKGHSLVAQPFDKSALRVEAEPVVVLANVSTLPALRASAFWVSETGTLVYRSGLGLGNERLIWIGRNGHSAEAAPPATYTSLRLSADGKRAAVGLQEETDFTDLSEIWIVDFERRATTRFTFGPEWNACPVWSPDGRQIAFASSRGGNLQLYRKYVQGLGAETLLSTPSPEFKCPMDWSRDGRFLLYAQSNGGLFDLWALPLDELDKPFLVVPPPFDKPDAQFSPDGRWVAYTSNESGHYEVYVKAFQASVGEEAKWRVSNDGGRAPRWRGDSKELFYVSLDNKIKAVKMGPSVGGGTPADTPHELFAAAIPGNLGENQYPYDISPDGQRFLVEESSGRQTSAPLIVLVNWQAALRR